jgi:hypothetical protein
MHHDKEINTGIWKEITLNYLGNRVRGSYKVVGRLVIVVSGADRKTASLGILPAERLAQMLLREMAFEKRHKSPFDAMMRVLNNDEPLQRPTKSSADRTGFSAPR